MSVRVRQRAAGLTNADQRITEDVEKFSFAIAELVRPLTPQAAHAAACYSMWYSSHKCCLCNRFKACVSDIGKLVMRVDACAGMRRRPGVRVGVKPARVS